MFSNIAAREEADNKRANKKVRVTIPNDLLLETFLMSGLVILQKAGAKAKNAKTAKTTTEKVRPEIRCFSRNLAVNYFTFAVLN